MTIVTIRHSTGELLDPPRPPQREEADSRYW
jgi:hypothetical protein